MLKTRLIPILLLKNGLIVRSETFSDWRELGNPISQLQRLSEWEADELIYIDITRSGNMDQKRDDHKVKMSSDLIEIVRSVAKVSCMPLTFGGRIYSLEQVDELMKNGADKVVINTGAYLNPQLISEVANKYGSQAVVVGIDVKEEKERHYVYIKQGTERVMDDPIAYAQKVERLGAGEIFINSINRDGRAQGYDISFVAKLCESVAIPVVAAGGAGSFDDFVALAQNTAVSGIAAGNIFNFTERAYVRAKRALQKAGIPVRFSAV